MIDQKILCLDIENFPCEVYSWGLGEQNISLDFLKRDYSICAWGAKWLHKDEVFYQDNRGKRNIYDDKELLKPLISLINEADILIGQNIDSFDLRKIRSRAEFNKLPPFKPCKTTDILTEERKVFAHTSHKLAFKTRRNEQYQKLKHEKYPGFDLWVACMEDKLEAWKEMEKYCKHDVLSTAERYMSIRGWIKTHHVGPSDGVMRCRCGSTDLGSRGYAYTDTGKFRIYKCNTCGKWPRSSINLLTKEQKQAKLREVK